MRPRQLRPNFSSPSGRGGATGGEGVVQITSRNQIALGARMVQRIWLPTPRAISTLTGATTSKAAQVADLGNAAP